MEVLRHAGANPVSHLIALKGVGISDRTLTGVAHHHVVHLALLLVFDEVSDRAGVNADVAQHSHLLIGEELW